LLTRTAEIIRQWDVGFDVDYRYRRGWGGGEDSLREQLERKTELDLRMGFTTIGPQRAELEVLSHGALAEKKLSRGQQKILVVALNLALMDLVIAKTGNAPVLLLDDLGAELDRHNRQRILSEIYRRECQAFVTMIDSNLLEPPADEAATMFHVKHGALFSPAAPSE
jgi:DNA replication and repair protein RecF